MKRKLISLLTVSMFLFSCGNHSHEGSKTQSETTAQENHHHDEDSKTIELNNGEKWKVNPEMMVHVRSMENEINAFKGKDLADYKTLATKLGEYNKSLISSCTMEGKSHDELHVWLLPHIDLTDKLLKAENETEATKGLEDIRTSMKTFNQYFQ